MRRWLAAVLVVAALTLAVGGGVAATDTATETTGTDHGTDHHDCPCHDQHGERHEGDEHHHDGYERGHGR